jgi:hypothetical protein
MPGSTNRGKLRILQGYFGNTQMPSTFQIHLLTPATAPTAGTDAMSAVTQIAAGNGYSTGGYTLSRNTTDFDTFTEQDASTSALVQIKDVAWTATGGTLPASGSGARYAVLCDDNATLASRNVYYWWDLTSEREVSNGQTLTLQDMQINAQED